MDFWKQKFIENFNMEMVAVDLLDLIDEEKLYDFIIDKFNENFTYEELYELFSREMNKEDLESVLTEMGHDFKEIEDEETNDTEDTSGLYENIKKNFYSEEE